MTNNELLLSMSDLSDTKLKPINDTLNKIHITINDDIFPRIQKLETTVNNEILPRLNTIESCYLSTYERYKKGIEQLDSMQVDVDVLKNVVQKHSHKLQMIS